MTALFTGDRRNELIEWSIEKMQIACVEEGRTQDNRVAFCLIVDASRNTVAMIAAVPPMVVDLIERALIREMRNNHLVALDMHFGTWEGEPCGRSRADVAFHIARMCDGRWLSGSLVDDLFEARRLAYKAATVGHKWA